MPNCQNQFDKCYKFYIFSALVNFQCFVLLNQWLPTLKDWETLKDSKVVSSGHFHAFHVVFVPQEYVPTIPLHSTYVMVNYFVLFKSLELIQPYTLVGPPVKRPVLAPLAVYSLRTVYVCAMRRYSRNILQWNKNNIKSTRMTTGDYFQACLNIFLSCILESDLFDFEINF